MTGDRIRISDADRDRAAAWLREHFTAGRLSPDELDERIAAALTATTAGDVRRIMADLPDPVPAPSQTRQSAPGASRPAAVFRRRPRTLPLAVFALTAALVIPGAGWLFLEFLQLVVALWLAAVLAGIFAATRLRRHIRRDWQPVTVPTGACTDDVASNPQGRRWPRPGQGIARSGGRGYP